MYQGYIGPLAVIMDPLHLQYNWYFHSVWKSQKILASFWKTEACCHIVLPDRSILIGQKLVEITIIKIYATFLSVLNHFFEFTTETRFARYLGM